MDITLSLFPKFYKHLDVHQLADLVREVGLDTTNAVIRDGYWVSSSGLAKELPEFVQAMRGEGLEVKFATAGFSAADLLADPTPLAIMAESGIADFRIGYFQESKEGPRASLLAARSQLEQLAPLCELHRIRAVYQVHHGTLITNASAAWHLVNGLSSKWIGIELDPGNQGFEGFEYWGRSVRLLADYLAAVGVKDTAPSRDLLCTHDPDKGWRRAWAPLDEGVTNWHDLVRSLAAVNFQGTFVFMPFYHADDSALMTEKLKREVAYLRGVIASIELG